MMQSKRKNVAILATLDTKGHEAQFLKERINENDTDVIVIDIGVMGEALFKADFTNEDVAKSGGKSLTAIRQGNSFDDATATMIRGSEAIIKELIAQDKLHGVIGLGGFQGTSCCTKIMQTIPYGIPKVMVSTVASGNVAPFVDIKDITMMFSVGDILGLNAVLRQILQNAAGAVCGMAKVAKVLKIDSSDKPLIGITNLGVLTKGTMLAIKLFEEAGYDCIVFHAVGSGGRSMEQMMKDGIIGAVFDYSLGEIADELYDGVRAGGAERLKVAGPLGLPQVICPGGAEHIGVILNEAHAVPEKYKNHKYVFHNPVTFVPRLNKEEMEEVAKEVCKRLEHTKGNAVFMYPNKGVSRYSENGKPLHDLESDNAFKKCLKDNMPKQIDFIERDACAEDPSFVKEAVDKLIQLIEK